MYLFLAIFTNGTGHEDQAKKTKVDKPPITKTVNDVVLESVRPIKGRPKSERK